MIGNESCGKSSLIKNILKCDIFPINKRIGTKMPIKLDLINSIEKKYIIYYKNENIRLNNKENIKYYIDKIMNELGDDIIEDELNIQFYDPNVINNTFYDLPGIKEYPESLSIKTKNIIDKYINIPNTLIICVIPVTIPRLTSNQALGMIIKANKCKDCIIVLTMIDLLHFDDYEELLVNRLLKKNDELKNINIHNICGVINKNINEDEWYNKHMSNYLNKIKNNITLNILLNQINLLYHYYITTIWKPQGLHYIDKQTEKLNNDLIYLGKEDLNLDDVYKYIKNKINFDNLNIYVNFINSNNILLFTNKKYSFLDFYDLIKNKFNKFEIISYKDYNIKYKDAENDINIFKKYYYNIKNLIMKDIFTQINNIFVNDITLKLIRFEKFKKVLLILYQYIIECEFIKLDEWFNNKISDLNYNLSSSNDFIKFNNLLQINIKRFIINNLNKDNFEEILCYDNESCNQIVSTVYVKEIDKIKVELLEESEEYKNKRTTIKRYIEKYLDAYLTISNIEKLI